MTDEPVAPVEGHYGLTNFGTIYRISRPGNLSEKLGRIFTDDYEEMCWDLNGKCTVGGPSPLHDIIATISPEAMQAVASGELERLRAALNEIDALDPEWQGIESCHPDTVKDLVMRMGEIARAALAEGESDGL